MSIKKPSISISRKATLKADWKDFSSNIVEAVANFALKGWADGGVSGVVALSKIATSFSIEESAEDRAWRLMALCFAWAIDDIKGKEQLDVEQLRIVLRKSLDLAKAEIDAGHEQIDGFSLTSPSTIPLYVKMREVVLEHRVELGIKENWSDDDLRSKINTSFTLGMFEIWSSDAQYFNILSDALNNPATDAAERELNWLGYKQALIYSFEVSPTFGQEDNGISLSQVYVPLRAYWEGEDVEGRRDRNNDGRLPRSARGVMLDACLDAWIQETDSHDWLRLIGGGPGSGKSTSLRALASRLAHQDGVRPLFIPLQHIGIAGDLREAINRHFVNRSGSAFTKAPLERASVEAGPPLVLIFDGLDELVAPNENAKETISQFVHKMNTMVHELRGGPSSNLKVIVSGRMLAFQSARRLMTLPGNGALEVYGYLPASQRGLEHPDEIWDLDQRKTWWERYARATGISSELPKAFNVTELDSITHEPLLAYLLVLAGFASHNWEKAAENPNRIYAALMSDIYERGWGEASTKTKTMTGNEFNRLMQTIGLAAWLGGDSRVASESSFLSTLVITRAEDAWRNFNSDQGPDVTNLAMNFYLKADDKSGRGFEFTHKSFGEYLAAVAILEAAISVYRMTGFRLEYTMQEWFKATSSGNLTWEILKFVRQEARLRISDGKLSIDEAEGIKTTFENVVDAASYAGFSVNSIDNWRTAEKRQLNAESSAWAILNAITRAMMNNVDQRNVSLSVRSASRFGLRNLLIRHSGMDGFPDLVANCLTSLTLKDTYIFGVHNSSLDMSYSTAEHLIIEGSTIYSGTLRGSSFKRLSIHDCSIINFDFSDVSVDKLSIVDSNFRSCSFERFNAKIIRIDEETILSSFPGLPLENGPSIQLYSRGADDKDVRDNTTLALTFLETLPVEGRSP